MVLAPWLMGLLAPESSTYPHTSMHLSTAIQMNHDCNELKILIAGICGVLYNHIQMNTGNLAAKQPKNATELVVFTKDGFRRTQTRFTTNRCPWQSRRHPLWEEVRWQYHGGEMKYFLALCFKSPRSDSMSVNIERAWTFGRCSAWMKLESLSVTIEKVVGKVL